MLLFTTVVLSKIGQQKKIFSQKSNLDGSSYLNNQKRVTRDCLDSEKDCMGICHGIALIDACGTCGGNNESCTDCNGDIFGKARWDCGICIGGKTGLTDKTRKDCMGICFGVATVDTNNKCCNPHDLDQCGHCFGDNSCVDCNGDVDGVAVFDECGTCSGGNTRIFPNSDKDCNGVCFGSARIDECNVCSGGNTGYIPNSNMDCNGICFGTSKLDVCGVCGGDGSSCLACDGLANSGAIRDVCGVCNGDNSTCCGPFGNCNNKGICRETNKGECHCDLGWTGKYCTSKADLCRWQTCNEHGRCSQTSGECICDEGYTGDHCEYSTCSYHGIADIDHNGICNCFPGYTGSSCDRCGSPSIPNTLYVCVSNYDQDINKLSIDQKRTQFGREMIVNPIRFTMFALSKKTAARVLVGDHPLTISDKSIAILPGTSINGTVYGCDCKPAIPVQETTPVPIQEKRKEPNLEEPNNNNNDKQIQKKIPNPDYFLKKTDAITIKQKLHSIPTKTLYDELEKHVERYTKFMPGGIRHLRRHVSGRALTSNEANTFLNQLFDFFNEEADAFTDTPETVGNAVERIEDSVEDQETATLAFFGITIGIIFAMLSVAIISIIVVTGGNLSPVPPMIKQNEERDY